MRFSPSTRLLMFLSLETLTPIVRTGLPILMEQINLVNSAINYLKLQKISNYLTQMVNFPTQIPDCDSHSPALLDLFLSSDTSICSKMDFPPLENSDHVVVSVSIDFSSNSQRDAPFQCIVYDYSCAVYDGLCDHLIEISWENIFELGTLALASEFCGWVVYIPHGKYQVKSRLSPWFSAACAAVIVSRNHFVHMYQKDKSTDSKVKFRHASNHCKRVLEAAKLAYANKTKESITSQELGSCDFWQIANSVLNKGKSAIPPLFDGRKCCLLHLIKQNCLLKTFLRTVILKTQVSLYLFSLLELI